MFDKLLQDDVDSFRIWLERGAEIHPEDYKNPKTMEAYRKRFEKYLEELNSIYPKNNP